MRCKAADQQRPFASFIKMLLEPITKICFITLLFLQYIGQFVGPKCRCFDVISISTPTYTCYARKPWQSLQSSFSLNIQESISKIQYFLEIHGESKLNHLPFFSFSFFFSFFVGGLVICIFPQHFCESVVMLGPKYQTQQGQVNAT